MTTVVVTVMVVEDDVLPLYLFAFVAVLVRGLLCQYCSMQ